MADENRNNNGVWRSSTAQKAAQEGRNSREDWRRDCHPGGEPWRGRTQRPVHGAKGQSMSSFPKWERVVSKNSQAPERDSGGGSMSSLNTSPTGPTHAPRHFGTGFSGSSSKPNYPSNKGPYNNQGGYKKKINRSENLLTQLVTISDWQTLAAKENSLSIVLKLQEFESSWVRVLQSDPSANLLSLAFQLFNRIKANYRYDLLALMKSLFTPKFFAVLSKILGDVKTSWLSMGIENVASFIEYLRKSLKFLLLSDPAFHDDPALKKLISDLIIEVKTFISQINAKLLEFQGKEDERLCKEGEKFDSLDNIKYIEMLTMSESPYPDNFLSPYVVHPNNINRPYESDDHYVQTHFSLLKEDYQSVLREGVEQYLAEPKKKNFNIWAYENVVLEYNTSSVFTPYRKAGINNAMFRIFFPECNYLDKIRWNVCKRFMHNSLVVLTEDRFQTYHLATVLDRAVGGGEKPFVGVHFVGSRPPQVKDKKFLLVEPKVFFEPYLNSLKVLKHMAQIGVPLKKYVVRADFTVANPTYIKENTVYKIDGREVEINRASSWPSAVDLNLNESQKLAFMNALTNEIALIQGPPGTGKTFLAFKIIHSLLDNRVASYLKGPILVVCYKNHSLDQILGGLLNRGVKVLRIGGQTKREELKYQFNVKSLPPPPMADALQSERMELERNLSSTLNQIKKEEDLIKCLNDRIGIVGIDVFKKFNIVSEDLDLDIVQWLMELVERRWIVDISRVEPLSSICTYWRSCQEFFECSLPSFQETIFSRISPSLIHHDMQHYQAICENMRYALDAYFYVKHALKIKPDPKHCPDTSAPEFDYYFLGIYERWALYDKWVLDLIAALGEHISILHQNIPDVEKKLSEYEELIMSANMKFANPDVIGVTTTCASRHYAALSGVGAKIVLVEEAAEVLEAHVISSLSTKCEHLIMIGDHQQLRPSTASMKLSLSYRMNVSFFERAINNKAKFASLSTQHRMRPEISALICPSIYPNLTNNANVSLYPNVGGMAKNVFFFSHLHPEMIGYDSESKYNPQEAIMVVAVCEYLLSQTYKPSDITILSTYLEHDRHIKKIISSKQNANLTKVMTTVVDNFQGEENTIILLSLVRSNEGGDVGFLSSKNRVCVALSRAKHGLFIFGNMTCLCKKEPTIWNEVNQVLIGQGAVDTKIPMRCNSHGNVTNVATPAEIEALKYGGCNLSCNAEMVCGHACTNLCHGYDPLHRLQFTCKQRCLKMCPAGHPCPQLCSEDCPPCSTMVTKTLSCGHTQSLACKKAALQEYCEEVIETKLTACGHNQMVLCRLTPQIERVACKATCGAEFSCGHRCKRTCHVHQGRESHSCVEKCDSINVNCPRKHRCTKKCGMPCGECELPVEKILPCNHKGTMPCYLDVSKFSCFEKCSRQLTCGHECSNECFASCGPCKVLVDKVITECGHQVMIACQLIPTRSNCNKACESVLPCGHQCTEPCNRSCDRSKCQKKVAIKFSCGHAGEVLCCDVGEVDVLRPPCNQPCKTVLPCGHQCQGTCNICMLGGLHKPCSATCNKKLICDHKCTCTCTSLCHTCERNRCFKICWKEELQKQPNTRKSRKRGQKFTPSYTNPEEVLVNNMIDLMFNGFHTLEAVSKDCTQNFSEISVGIQRWIRKVFDQGGRTIDISTCKSNLFKIDMGIMLARINKRFTSLLPQSPLLEKLIRYLASVITRDENVNSFQITQIENLINWSSASLDVHELSNTLNSSIPPTLAAAQKLLSDTKLSFNEDARKEFHSIMQQLISAENINFQSTSYSPAPTSKWWVPLLHHRVEKCKNPTEAQEATKDGEEPKNKKQKKSGHDKGSSSGGTVVGASSSSNRERPLVDNRLDNVDVRKVVNDSKSPLLVMPANFLRPSDHNSVPSGRSEVAPTESLEITKLVVGDLAAEDKAADQGLPMETYVSEVGAAEGDNLNNLIDKSAELTAVFQSTEEPQYPSIVSEQIETPEPSAPLKAIKNEDAPKTVTKLVEVYTDDID